MKIIPDYSGPTHLARYDSQGGRIVHEVQVSVVRHGYWVVDMCPAMNSYISFLTANRESQVVRSVETPEGGFGVDRQERRE